MNWRRTLASAVLFALLAGCASGPADVEPEADDGQDTYLSCPPASKDGGDETDGGVGGTGKLPEQCRDRGE